LNFLQNIFKPRFKILIETTKMNLFILSKSSKKNARYHCDKHVVKMILELAQMLCTCHRFLDGILIIVETETKTGSKKKKKVYKLEDSREEVLYGATHINHPCNIWLMKSSENYEYMYKLFLNLCKEYTYRYEKIHKCERILSEILKKMPDNIPTGPKTDFAQAMPDYCKNEKSAVRAYRKYYNNEKRDLFKWKKRDVPHWIIQ
jgi:hypothetical protein